MNLKVRLAADELPGVRSLGSFISPLWATISARLGWVPRFPGSIPSRE